MIYLNDNQGRLVRIAAALLVFGFWLAVINRAFADEAPKCPTPGEPCRVVYLSPQEEKLLSGQNGVLDTAAQARSLDLGQFVVYFKTKLAQSPMGETRPLPLPAAGPGDLTPGSKNPN